MIPQAHITAWRATAPWPDDAQVEQDLVLTRAAIELFAASQPVRNLAVRGGTALHKLYLRPASRYSEDIDLVQTRAAPIGDTIDAIRAALDPWLGKPQRDRSVGSVSLIYRFESEIPPVRPLRLKVEINTREHFAILGYARQSLRAENPWFTGEADIATFAMDELMATKLRALYQRRKGRDLFDLWLSLDRGLIEPRKVVECFADYMQHEGHSVSRAEFEENLHDKLSKSDFLHDINPLLRTDVQYDPAAALNVVRDALITLLPGDSWRGPPKETRESGKRRGRKRS